MSEKFKLPVRNSCSKCGKIMLQGDFVHANNYDEVLAGKAICASCANPKKSKKEEAEE